MLSRPGPWEQEAKFGCRSGDCKETEGRDGSEVGLLAEQFGTCSFNSLLGWRRKNGSEGCSGIALCLCVGLTVAGTAGRPGGGQAHPEGISLVASLGFQRVAAPLPVQLHPTPGARYKGGSAVPSLPLAAYFGAA